MEKYVYSESLFNTLCTEIKQILKFPLVQNMPWFFFRELQLITVSLLIHDFYMSWRTKFVYLKVCMGFSIFNSVSILLKLYICFQQKVWALRLQNVIIPFKITHSFAPRPLIFKSWQEVFKFSDICVSWNSPEIDLETNFLNLGNRSFADVSFFR